MERRNFIKECLLVTTGCALADHMSLFAENADTLNKLTNDSDGLYKLFKSPLSIYRPFVRWWWNGDKVEAKELIRELHLLKDAGIGGVEINPIRFPINTDDLGKKSLTWLSDKWIEMLQVTFDEAKSLDMTCDLIVGSGWPFGGEFLTDDERADIIINYSEKLEGPLDYEVSEDGLFCAANPSISSPFIGRTMELLSLQLVPEPFGNLDQIIDLKMTKTEGQSYKFKIPDGKYVLFALVKIHGFLGVIEGAPGAEGPVLNHFNKNAVRKYLNNMSDKIQKKSSPLSNHIRSLFHDSMELEGSNWTSDMADEFRKRRGYDIIPYLPFILFKIGNMGNALTYVPKVKTTPDMENAIQRIRYDFEYTKAELLHERFDTTYQEWCRGLKVKSRAQAYGRGFFPLESSLDYDIPECESWTMTWLKHKLGEEMSEQDYRRGRAYTMVNKYVSSAAHLRGKRLVSCEEMTNTYTVFNMTLELLKIGGDQSAITGVTHSIFHGFNYSPKEAPFPGWIRYGAYYNEKNNWWPYFKYYTDYKGRLAAVLQNATMFAEVALLYPLADLWSTMGMQNEPFPSATNVTYKTLIWEAINKNGDGCDYVSESIIQDAEMKKGYLCYGPKKYKTLFLVQVERLNEKTTKKLADFVECGGRIFCIEAYPNKSSGWYNYQDRDKEVQQYVENMKQYSDRFILLHKPEHDFVDWYTQIQKKHHITPYLNIDKPDLYLMQNRYQTNDKSEMFFFNYSHRYQSHQTRIAFSSEIVKGRQGWVWNLENGQRYKLELDRNNSRMFDFGPADSLLIVFDKHRRGQDWRPLPTSGQSSMSLDNDWDVELQQNVENTVQKVHFDKLIDLKDSPQYVKFCGTAIYRKTISISSPTDIALNLGSVQGVCELFVNGTSCGVKWYGRRIYSITDLLVKGDNNIEVHVITTMGNYMKTLTDNKIAQKWINRKNAVQADQPMGLIGPVSLYKIN
ncbi:MAG: glycosyl hydrolase [Massilibacteroides sp.]|nr:glycosyl hydrolase [Massilibacteroides sp.]